MSISCMGGFCASRDQCKHYHECDSEDPVERLCGAIERPAPMGADRVALPAKRNILDWQISAGRQTSVRTISGI